MQIKNSSSFLVFSIFKNIEKMLTKKKYDIDIFASVNRNWYNNAKPYSVKYCKRIYNDIENCCYSYTEFAVFLLYQYIFNKEICWSSVNKDSMKDVLKMFTKQQIDNDVLFLKDLNDELKFSSLHDYFKMTEDGFPLIYKLIMKGYISLAFYLKYKNKYLTVSEENANLLHEDFETFDKVSSIIKNIL
jgi:hypothetical protein